MLTKPQSSRRTRITASVAAAALGLVSMGLATGIADAAVADPVPAANANLNAQCGLDIGLILDGSGSIGNPGKGTSQNPISAVPDVRAAAKALLSPLTDTNTNAGIVSFATAMKDDANVSMQALTSSSYSSTFVPEIDAYTSGGFTNWDIALRTAKQNFLDSANNRPGVPNLVVFITDGAPNTTGGTTGATSGVTGNNASPDASAAAVNPAITAANAIKNTADTHILTIGAGQAFNNNASAVNYRKALAQVSGGGGVFGGGSASAVFDAFDPGNVLTAAEKGVSKYTTQSPLNISTADVIFVQSFSDLSNQLKEIANKLCGGSLTIKKLASTPDAPGTYAPAAGWDFKATPAAANASYEWIAPNASASDTNQTGTTAGAQGAVGFQWKITDSSNWNNNKNIAIDETEKANFGFDSVVCEKNSANGPVAVSVADLDKNTGTFKVPVGATDIVNCTVKNTALKRIDLELDKTIVGGAPYSVDTNRTWNLSVTNKGPSDATGVVVKDYVPAGFTVNTGALPGSATLSSGVVTWNVGNLANGQTKTLDIAGTLTATGSMTNWAQVTSANEVDTDSTPNNCTINGGVLGNAEDDCDKVTINVTRDYNLDIDKVRVGSGAVGVGDQVQYDLKVTNNGESTSASGFVVTDQVNAGLTNVSVSPNAPGAANWNCTATVGNAVSCTYNATLAKGAAAVSVRVTATVGPNLANAESVPNTACVKKGPNATTNDDCDDEIIDLTPRSDLEITKKSVPDPSVVVTGSNASWKYSVKNLGPSVKKLPFTVTDTLPNGLTNVSINGGAGWNCPVTNIAGPTSGSTFTCTFTPGGGGLAVNASTTDVTVTASTVNVVPAQGATTPLPNKACVSDSFNETTGKTGDVEGQNDCSTATVTVTPKVDLQMNKSAQAPDDATVGSTITYNFSVTNKGPSAATVIEFSDTFDAGLTDLVLQPTGSNWDCSLVAQSLNCEWTGPAVADEGTTTPDVVVTAKVGTALADAANVKNTACIAEDDIKGDESRDSVNVTGADCDTTTTDLDPKFALVIDKDQVEDNPVAVGGTVTYDLTVYNQGPSKATSGFVVSDTVPSLLDVTAVTPSSADWNCTASSGNVVSCTWEGDDLAVGAAPVITVTATVTQDAANADAVFNTACVAKDGQQEGIKRVSLVIDEEQEVLTECDTVTTEFPKGNISVGKAAFLNEDETVGDEGTTLDGFGGTITYVLGASASGNLDQTNVVVTDTVPTIGNPAGNELNTTLVGGSVVCVDGPNGATNAVIPCAGAVDSTPNDLSWNVGTVTAGTTKWVEFKVTVDVPSVGDVDTDATSFNVRNVGAVTSDYTEEPVPSNPVDTPVAVSRVIPNKAGDCIDDTPVFGVDGTGFYAGETVKMRVFDKDGNLVSDEYANAVADSNGNVTFEDILWPGFSVEQPGNIKTYPGPQFANIQVELYGSPTSNRVTIGYPPAESGCAADLEIEKSNNPTKDVTITEFGAEITYTMDVTAPEQNVYNSEDVVVTDVLPGYDTLTSGTVSYKAGSAICDATIPELGANSICDASFVPNTVTWELGDMRPGDTRQVSFVVTVDIQSLGDEGNTVADFTIQNQASVDSLYSDPVDSNVVENPVLVELTRGIEITKTASNNPGGPIGDAKFFPNVAGVVNEKTTFRFEVTNNSATPVSDLVLTDDNLRFAANAGAGNLEKNGTPYVDSSLIENCQVGVETDPEAAFAGFAQPFTLGEVIGDNSEVVLGAGKSVLLYCDITVPDIQPASLYETDGNRIYNDASIAGTAEGLGGVENDSNVASIALFAEKLDIFPIKSIVDEDGTNARGFDNLGKIAVPTLKTFDMTIDNVSDTTYDVTLYDYFFNASPGLTKAQRDAIFDNMVCLDYDDPASVNGGNFPTSDTFAAGPEVFDLFSPTNESTDFGPATNGQGAGTFNARGFDLGPIGPGDGYEIVCQTTLPTGDYSLTNAFRMVANPAENPDDVQLDIVKRQAAAATGSLDVIATAGVVVGVPGPGEEEEEEPGTTPEPQVKGVKLPKTGLEIPVGTLMALGIALVGTGIILGMTARRRDENGEQI